MTWPVSAAKRLHVTRTTEFVAMTSFRNDSCFPELDPMQLPGRDNFNSSLFVLSCLTSGMTWFEHTLDLHPKHAISTYS